jgi:DNA-binding FadR family transcriptional regulator
MNKEPIQLIQVLAKGMRVACAEITTSRLAGLQESAGQANRIPAKPEWDRKAAAHAEFFSLLAEATDDAHTARVLVFGAGFAYDLMIAVGRVADGVVQNSHERLFTHLRAGDAEAAAYEMEECLKILYWLWRLAHPGRCLSLAGQGTGRLRGQAHSGSTDVKVSGSSS